ncbi:MAG: cytidyltransferase [Zetaproteobacteria bacterium CG06_land_8_20_14_3_00_59_53]|nr:MAG: cytidyltransferase [Zetaproteobacteria bacterium CG2_30_59_37]PIO89913.1 MAG: cytidyltransferase [Zetaproteobacteria bacterium CG23_combo_of_CG06-09_8_20_14_all_59_86]PIQ64279.1 MAG: cytidyltransferase [Zetaproteobacteria bacterium CG11_big_fil_rev_8_21_14_0_20_59_439]PIU70376.1 MAG: cytidyltransferase [Zetaproteobacteria bacterium CG06_land_8_20_14_3_00_59_53]PIU97501.1 MAG: cytidyltransferase [Zetaproteobacteria bacterium CG03_land_8_20_14_0_80_59_51]PIY46586.1 MAG: cytidyltransferas
MTSHKIISLKQMAEQCEKLKSDGNSVVLCHGTFDLMHIGHVRYLQRARQEGAVLLVTVTADEFVNKGPGRPVFNEQLRAESLASLACVDFVAINHALTAVDALQLIRPSVYVKGSEYRSHSEDVTGNIVREVDAVEEHGGRVFYTDEITFSSSSLLNEHFDIFSPETRSYLKDFREKWSAKDVFSMLESLSGLRVLVIGDAIIDQYHYTTPMGQTGKGNTLAVKYDSEEQFAGGSIAVANHVAGFAKHVTLVTGLGSKDSYEDYIRSKLLDNVEPSFFAMENAPTVTKRRFVDGDLGKLFEVCFYEEDSMTEKAEQAVCDWIERHVEEYDLVLVPDFGNGFITDPVVDALCNSNKFLAVNTQVNSANRGFHVIKRYSRADFVSLNEPEVRLAAHDRHTPIEAVAQAVGEEVKASAFAVTRGTKGAMMLDLKEGMVHSAPALSTKVVDRIGAGDSFLSLAGLCLGGKLPSEVAVFVGSAAAAIDVQIVCNREPISMVGLKKYITTLLK